MSLVARHLEANGIPTVMFGCARDIIENCGVARFVFSDFPLGNPCGEPFNADMQLKIVSMALDLLETAKEPRTTVQTPFKWPAGDAWKDKVFTKEQPFVEGEAYDRWMEGKATYKKLKAEGKV
ncbi:MAG: hypothetical protein V2J25_05020 [Desulfatiglans sp.]|nr:hypothetical protein [Desulfatiglans sp.]